MKKIFKRIIIYAMLLMLVFLEGCSIGLGGSHRSMNEEIYVYYLLKDGSGIGYEKIDVAGDTNVLETLIEALGINPEDPDLKRTMGSDTRLLEHEFTEGQLLLYFDESYKTMSRTDEILFRAAVTRTVCQAKGVDGVSFFVGKEPCKNIEGDIIGVMTPEIFIDASNDSMGNYDRIKLTLYFASEDGKSLVSEERSVVYSTNVAVEKLVVEQLLKGPEAENAQAALSDARKINSVSVKDGICYVDLSEIVLDGTIAVSEEVSVYSIVNSLTELDYINKVQIMIDGETQRNFRNQINLDQTFERKL